MIIPGQLVSIITFPGVIVHELAHQFFCRICKIPVYDVKYFQVANPNGYVIHEATDKPLKNFLTGMGPFFINTLLGMIIVLPASIDVLKFNNFDNMLNLLLVWLGISIMMHAFPSTGDAKSMVHSILKNPDVNFLVKILVAPFIGLIYLGAIGSMFWLDLLYAVLMAMILPDILILFMR